MAYSVRMSLFVLVLSKLHAMPTDREPFGEVNIGNLSIDTLNTLNLNLNWWDTGKGTTDVAVDKVGTRNNQSLINNNDDTKLVAEQTMQLLRQFMASTNAKIEHLIERENKTQQMITETGHVSDEMMQRLNLVLQRLDQSRLVEKTLDAIASVKTFIENSARNDTVSPDILTVEKFNVTMTYLLERIEKEKPTDDSTHWAQHIMHLLRQFNASTNSQLERLLELENNITSTSRNHTEEVMEVLGLVLQRLNQSRQEHNILEAIDKLKALIENRLIVGNDTVTPGQTMVEICNETLTRLVQSTENEQQNDGDKPETPEDCQEVYKRGHLQTSVYVIKPRHATSETRVRCEMSGTKWTVLMRRFNGAVDFNRTWHDYKHGFGNPFGEYWAGNEFMHLITNQGQYKLRVDLRQWGTGNTYYAEFSNFRIGPETDSYRLHISGHSGTAPEGSMSYHNRKRFSTKDRRFDHSPLTYSGGWWFENGYNHYLNGPYNNKCHGQCSYWNGIGALQAMSMKVSRI